MQPVRFSTVRVWQRGAIKMKKLMSTLLNWLNKGEDAALVTIIGDYGSAPRGTGARMAIIGDGSFTGTIGGGAVEYRIQQTAQEVLMNKKSRIMMFDLSSHDKEGLGMVCGGKVTVYIQYISALDGHVRNLLKFGISLFEQNIDSWLVTDITDGSDGCMNIYKAGSGAVSMELLANRAVQVEIGGKRYYSEPLTVTGRVYIFGGGHISQELVPLLSRLEFCCHVFDDLPEFADAARFPDAERVIMGDFDDISVYIDITAKDYIVIVTRGHKHDYSVLTQVLPLTPYYIGAIGSLTKKDNVSKQLLEAGFLPKDIDRIHTPIGLPIHSETPVEIAVSIAAELILVRARKNDN
jgi:xanthine dehydrogenase accessory factor